MKIKPEEVEELYQTALLMGWPGVSFAHQFVKERLDARGVQLWVRWDAMSQRYCSLAASSYWHAMGDLYERLEAAHFVKLHKKYGGQS